MTLANVGPSALWYLTRSTGAVALVLLTVSVALGIANVGRLQAAGWPRFVIEGIHRNTSLLALTVLVWGWLGRPDPAPALRLVGPRGPR